MNTPTNELMINEKTIEMEILTSQEGEEAIKKFPKKGSVQLTPTDKLNVINISINDSIKQIKELNTTLKELKRKQKKLTKALKEIDNI
jgi:predicted transcriptional regulator